MPNKMSKGCDGCKCYKECYGGLSVRKCFDSNKCPCCNCIIKGICSKTCAEFNLFIKITLERDII